MFATKSALHNFLTHKLVLDDFARVGVCVCVCRVYTRVVLALRILDFCLYMMVRIEWIQCVSVGSTSVMSCKERDYHRDRVTFGHTSPI